MCKGSYTAGDLEKALTAAKDGTTAMVGSAGRSTRVSIGSFSTSVGREEISSCGDTNSATTFGPDSGSSTTVGLVLDLQLPCFLESFSRQLGSPYTQRLDR